MKRERGNADCRKCMHFIPIERIHTMEDLEREYMYNMINKWLEKHPNRRGDILGWCNAYARPVFYYTGQCYRYTKRPPKTIPLDKFI